MIRGAGSWSLLAWTISFTIITTIAVILRFWSIKIQKRKIYIDDMLVVASYVSMLAQQGVAIWAMIYGMGNSSQELVPEELIEQAKVVLAVSITWLFSTTTIKLAMLALYLRIFTTATFKRWAVSLMVCNICFGISFIVVFITHCHPVSQEWNPVPGGSCRSLISTELASASINLVLDTMIVLLPMPWLWRLKMALINKVIVMIMFGFGFATIAIMCYRVVYQVNGLNPDPILTLSRIGLLSNLELWFGIIVACMPTMAPFFRKYVHPSLSRLSRRLLSTSDTSKKRRTPNVQLMTFGSPNASNPKGYNNYTELSEASIYRAQDIDEMRLVMNDTPNVRVDCQQGFSDVAPRNDGIYVQKQFQTSSV